MNTPRILLFVLLTAACITRAQAQDNAVAEAQFDMQKWIATTDAQWQAAFKRDVTDVHDVELNKVKLRFPNLLETGIAKASAAGDLNGALALRSEQKRFGDTQVFPEKDEDGDAASVKAIRAAIRAQLAKLEKDTGARAKALHTKYDTMLAQAQTQLTQHQRLDDALLVKNKRDEVAAEWITPEITAALAAAEQPKPSPVSTASPRTPVKGVITGADAGKDTLPKMGPAGQRNALNSPVQSALGSLSVEDQQIVEGLRFSNPEAAPLDTRGLTYIKGRLMAVNPSPKHSITDALVVEMRMLCRNGDKVWSVIATARPFDINDTGKQLINISFPLGNDLIAKLNGNRNGKLYDAYTVVHYKGVLIYEAPGKNAQGRPKDWWKDDTLIYKK